MNTLDRLSRVIRNPRLFARGINRAYHRQMGLRSENQSGISVFDEDWDTLVVLDACRYDMFETENELEGDLSSRQSKGSATTEWLSANFDREDLRDTVYVTANPQLERNRAKWDISLHKTVNVWLDEGWEEETGTVLAETVTDKAINIHERFPNKRIIVHYMQPHYPFVRSRAEFDKNHLSSITDKEATSEGENVWGKKFLGEISITSDKLWSMYIDNLEYVLDHVKSLLQAISGKAVVTSDHGNYVGERASPIPIREFGHPRGIYDNELVQVPWLVCEYDKRRDIFLGDKDDRENIKSETVADRLHDLGYK